MSDRIKEIVDDFLRMQVFTDEVAESLDSIRETIRSDEDSMAAYKDFTKKLLLSTLGLPFPVAVAALACTLETLLVEWSGELEEE